MKSRLSCFLLFLFLNTTVFSQNTANTLSDTAFQYYLKGKYSNALLLYLELISVSKEDDNSFHINNMIGNCYNKLAENNKAIQFYKRAIENFDKINTPNYWGKTTCLAIANCAFILSQFDVCKEFLSKAKNWKAGKATHNYPLHFNQNLYHLYMKVYFKQGMYDSAIHVFAPFAFDEWTDNNYVYPSTDHIHEGDYHCKVNDFIDILKQKYSVTDIKSELRSLIKSSRSHLVLENDNRNQSENDVIYCASSYAYFFGVKLDQWGLGCTTYKINSIKRRKELRKSKAILKYQIKSSLLYRLFESGLVNEKQ